MYQSHFGLREVPFSITPDTSFFFTSPHSQEALNTLLVAARSGEGFIKITGEVGTGKTLLCRKFLATLGEEFVTAYIPNPYLEPRTLMLALADELELTLARDVDQHQLLKSINYRLLELAGQGKQVVLCLDEAQAIPVESLEALRLLTNLETEKRKLLQIVLFGQPELNAHLESPTIRQLAQRITFHYHLGALSRDDLDYYLAHRLRVAGHADGALFQLDAAKLIARTAGADLHVLVALADKSLNVAAQASAPAVAMFHVRDAIKGVPAQPAPSSAPPPIAPQSDTTNRAPAQQEPPGQAPAGATAQAASTVTEVTPNEAARDAQQAADDVQPAAEVQLAADGQAAGDNGLAAGDRMIAGDGLVAGSRAASGNHPVAGNALTVGDTQAAGDAQVAGYVLPADTRFTVAVPLADTSTAPEALTAGQSTAQSGESSSATASAQNALPPTPLAAQAVLFAEHTPHQPLDATRAAQLPVEPPQAELFRDADTISAPAPESAHAEPPPESRSDAAAALQAAFTQSPQPGRHPLKRSMLVTSGALLAVAGVATAAFLFRPATAPAGTATKPASPANTAVTAGALPL
eukprot:gene34809-42929_t